VTVMVTAGIAAAFAVDWAAAVTGVGLCVAGLAIAAVVVLRPAPRYSTRIRSTSVAQLRSSANPRALASSRRSSTY